MNAKTKEFIEKANARHLNKYDYTDTVYINSTTKIKFRCPSHGIVEQTPNSHLRSGGCRLCGIDKRIKKSIGTTDSFTKKAVAIHGNSYDYSKTIYVDSSTKVCIICKECGEEFYQRPSDHLRGKGCLLCSYKRRGDNQTLTTQTFIKKAIEKHGKLYNYSEVHYERNDKKVCIICPAHGKFWQMPSSHLSGKGCMSCNRGECLDGKRFVRLAKKIHGDKFDYSKVKYINSKTPVTIICKKHGEFHPVPNNHISKLSGCPKCSHHVSKPELELQDWLESKIYIERNNRKIIAPKELDIYIPSKKFAIEYNGLYWHSELKGKNKKYHLDKTLVCNANGLRLIHITDDEWINKKDIVKSRLLNILGCTKYRLYGRKCTIKIIDKKVKNRFLTKYHIQGKDNSSVALGAFYKGRLVAVMTFGKNRYGDDKNCYELIRYATIASFNCVGVASKILKHFERNYTCDKIKTYADLRWSEGGLYKALGFTHTHNSPPNYHYIKNGKTVGSRVKYQKHKLKDILPIFDSTKSEWENMKINDYDRLWDCGNMVFEKLP